MFMDISLIIPVYNEIDSLVELCASVKQSMEKLEPISWEMVLVDDGSNDGSLGVIEKLAREYPEHVCLVALRRNYGQTTAITAGIDHSQGEMIVLMDADLQNDPADIPLMIEKLQQGYDVVSGWRKDRKDPYLTRVLPSHLANWLISLVTGVYLHDYGCTLKAYRREVLTGFRLYGEMHRFIPAFADSVGAKMVEIPVTHHARKYGKTKYGLGRTLNVILDLFTVKFLMSYAQKPIYLFGGVGLSLMGLSFITVLALIVRRIWYNEHMIRSPLLLMGMMLFILGAQSVLLGLLAEVLMRTYHESQHKPTYSVKQIVGQPPNNG
jgi:glycosyltransferase involved in cell wall biosynthesis